MRIRLLTMLLLLTATATWAATGTWHSQTTGRSLHYTTAAAIGTAAKDINGRPMTVVYLENLQTPRVSTVSNADNVAWLRNQGYQVIEIDYEGDANAVSPTLNADIIAINRSLMGGTFCGCTCSPSRSYVLMEGFRLQRDIEYYTDDPTVYNYPDVYKDTEGDALYLDLVYPALPTAAVPVVITFSYSNSFATNINGTLTDANKHMRMNLINFWGHFNDSFVEGASALGFAWAVCDHPKYCDWGQGRYTGGGNKSLGAIEVNPDALRKVRSAIRTVRAEGRPLGLSGDVAVTGFSRGATAAALAVGDGDGPGDGTRGRYPDESGHVQCALLGPGMFDYEHALTASTEYTRMSAYVKATASTSWQEQGALATIETGASAPTLFYHNSNDYYKDYNRDPQGLYATQAQLMKERLDAVETPTETLTDYATGHAVPQTADDLGRMYQFMIQHIPSAPTAAIRTLRAERPDDSTQPAYNLAGCRVSTAYKGIVIRGGRLVLSNGKHAR